MDKISFIMIFLVLFLMSLYLSYMVWFKFDIYLNWLLKAGRFYEKLKIPFTSRSIAYAKSPLNKWFTRFSMLFFCVVLLSLLILMIKG